MARIEFRDYSLTKRLRGLQVVTRSQIPPKALWSMVSAKGLKTMRPDSLRAKIYQDSSASNGFGFTGPGFRV